MSHVTTIAKYQESMIHILWAQANGSAAHPFFLDSYFQTQQFAGCSFFKLRGQAAQDPEFLETVKKNMVVPWQTQSVNGTCQ